MFFLGKMALWFLPKGWLGRLGQKPMCHLRLSKIALKKMCGGENKNTEGSVIECRLTRCPFEIWSVCYWSPVKMVYFFCLCRSFSCCRVVFYACW